MLVKIENLLKQAQREKYALGAFTVYNLETVLSVCESSESLFRPAIMQISSDTLSVHGQSFCRMVLNEADASGGRLAVQLDHCSDADLIKKALDWGIPSIMADGSSLSYEKNEEFTTRIVHLSKSYDAGVEGELGLIKGSEEGIGPGELNERMTDPEKAKHFLKETGIDHMAVCIGNRHGLSNVAPVLDISRLIRIRQKVSCPLVLHGGSGLNIRDLVKVIDAGICKINVNSEIRAVIRKIYCRKDLSLPDQSEKIKQLTADLISEKMKAWNPGAIK